MKFFTAAAVAILLSSGMAFAQDNTTTSSTPESGGTDAATYLTGPNIHRFYQDDAMKQLKSEADMKAAWDALTDKDREDLKQACMGNKDNRYNPLCSSVQAM